MATVYVMTAGGGNTYRGAGLPGIRTGLRVRAGLQRHRPGGTGAEEEWQAGAPPAAYDGPYWRAEWWARLPASKRRAALRHTDEGERFDEYVIRQEWWTGEALPDAEVVRRELTGVPKTEVVGRSNAKVEELFWDTITQARADLAAPRGNSLRSLCEEWKQMGMATRHCRPAAS